MLTPLNLSLASRFVAARILCWFSLALLIVSLAGVTGCGGPKGAKNTVSGKVTVNGEPANGIVVFLGQDNKELASTPIKPDGTYQFDDPPAGQVKVLVKGMMGGAPLIAPPAGKGPELPSMAGGMKGATPPPKYGQANTTPLTFEVKTGKQTFDIAMSP